MGDEVNSKRSQDHCVKIQQDGEAGVKYKVRLHESAKLKLISVLPFYMPNVKNYDFI